MKNKQLLCVLFPLLVACTGQRHQQQVSSESIIEEAVRKGEVLKGEIVPIDTALFRYAYRMRVQGDKAVILDLHNADYYYHVFTYPDFQYQSSFGKRGEGRVSPFMRRISVLQGRTRCGCLMTARAGCYWLFIGRSSFSDNPNTTTTSICRNSSFLTSPTGGEAQQLREIHPNTRRHKSRISEHKRNSFKRVIRHA